MNETEKMSQHGRRERRTVLWMIALVLLVAIIYVMTFIKLPGWLPALQ